jgi:hypothetical protein
MRGAVMPESFHIEQFHTEPGEHYFWVECPETGNLIALEHDPSHGTVPYPPGVLVTPKANLVRATVLAACAGA